LVVEVSQVDGPLVVLDRLSKRYGEGAVTVDAVREVSLAIGSGEFVVVLGPSGSGKTTLLNLIGGIEPPTGGDVTVGGTDLAGLDGGELTAYRRSTLGFVFQFFNLVPTLTARENVQLIAELDGADAEPRSVEALRSVGLEDRLDHFPGALSGGQQQRVAIARALVNRPPLLLCDEPTGSLDLAMGRQVLALLRRATGDGRTVLTVTHNAAIAAMADRVVRMGSGRLVEDRMVSEPIPADQVSW
jgi:putative ABC transport system ATP-binding protein